MIIKMYDKGKGQNYVGTKGMARIQASFFDQVALLKSKYIQGLSLFVYAWLSRLGTTILAIPRMPV